MNLDVFQMQQCEMQAALFESLGRRTTAMSIFAALLRTSLSERLSSSSMSTLRYGSTPATGR